MERNLMATRDGDSSSGELIDKSHKHALGQPAPISNATAPTDYLNVQQQPAVPLPMRPTLPIPFLQNVSSNENSQPKLSNLIAGARRRSTWLRIRQAFGGKSQCEDLIGNESAITVSTPVDDKIDTKVAINLYWFFN